MHQNENDNVISTIYFGERTKIGGHKSRETFRCCLRVYEVLTGLAKSNTLAGDNLWLQERKEIGSWSEKTPQHFLDCSTNWVVPLCLEIYLKCRIWIFKLWLFLLIFKVWKPRQNGSLLALLRNFCPKWKRSLLRSQCWMRLFRWVSNTVFSSFSFLYLFAWSNCF